MLNIILLFSEKHTNQNIDDYVNHIYNINSKILIKINIYIINTNKNINISYFNSINIISNNIKVFLYNYECEYNDSLYNDILNEIKYDNILLSDLNIFITPLLLEFILNNNIEKNSIYLINLNKLNNIPQNMINKFDNSTYYDIINNLDNRINKNDYIKEFNENDNIELYTNELIKNDNYNIFHNLNLLLFHKSIINNYGLNTSNFNPNFTLQYLLLNLLSYSNINIYKLPIKISTYTNFNFFNEKININDSYQYSNDYNSHINYKVFDILNNKNYSFIRNQIKTIKGYNPTKTISDNKYLINKNLELTNENQKYLNIIHHNNKFINIYFNNKWNIISKKYNNLYINLEIQKKKFISLFKILY